MFIKTVSKEGSDLEIELQTIASKYGFSPPILDIVQRKNGYVEIHMEEIKGDVLADSYGDDADDLPEWIWDDIRTMITALFELEGVEYIDITPYNFIETTKGIVMLDFGHAKYVDGPIHWFLSEFLDGENSWNPDYK